MRASAVIHSARAGKLSDLPAWIFYQPLGCKPAQYQRKPENPIVYGSWFTADEPATPVLAPATMIWTDKEVRMSENMKRLVGQWTPEGETREAIKFWLDCLQVVTLGFGILAAVWTVSTYFSQEAHRLEAVKRELRQPYEEKKLELYLEAAQVVAHLAATPREKWGDYEARFWQLYWGELAFVESMTAAEGLKTADGSIGPKPSVESLMVDFCNHTFPNRCSTTDKLLAEKAAIELARHASEEIRKKWEK
jgi:hypothetical protein